VFISDYLMQNEFENNNLQGSYEQVEEAVDYISGLIKIQPELGIVCGSGLGQIAENIKNGIKIDYNDIPHFRKSGQCIQTAEF
jgi:purine nucleoside phosphorylase